MRLKNEIILILASEIFILNRTGPYNKIFLLLDKGILIGLLECMCFPMCLPCLRYQIRDERGIDGHFLKDIGVGCCIFKF